MRFSHRSSLVVLLACVVALALASFADAAAPATVTVRVEGLEETKLPATTVTTSLTPVVKDGIAAHACPGTSALGALQLATGGNWSGPWNSEFNQYEIFSIEGELHEFDSASSANYFWSLWINDRESTVGACEAELQPGSRVLFFASCFGSACPPESLPLEVESPPTANVGEKVPVTVQRYNASGQGTPAEGATIAGAGEPATTGAGGRALVSFSHAGTYTLRASATDSVRSEATVCVHNGNDGTCGTQAPSNATSTATTSTTVLVAPYKGPFAIVAKAGGVLDGHVYSRAKAPRLLSGTVAAHSPIASVSLRLRRSYRGRCWSYDGVSERFVRERCGNGSSFVVSKASTFSYLLPAALAPGRYVLDIEATDAAGNRTSLARGSTRVVFYVR
jgi:hypothetical protein